MKKTMRVIVWSELLGHVGFELNKRHNSRHRSWTFEWCGERAVQSHLSPMQSKKLRRRKSTAKINNYMELFNKLLILRESIGYNIESESEYVEKLNTIWYSLTPTEMKKLLEAVYGGKLSDEVLQTAVNHLVDNNDVNDILS